MTTSITGRVNDRFLRAGRHWALAVMLLTLFRWSAAEADVMVFAPGAMAGAMEEIATAAGASGTMVKLAVGHSPAQARQIADGGPADLFISADPQWMAFLASKQLLAPGSPATLASTRLLLFAAADNPMAFSAQPGESLAAALGEGRLAIGDPDMMPAGRFARAALEKMGAWPSLQGRLARPFCGNTGS